MKTRAVTWWPPSSTLTSKEASSTTPHRTAGVRSIDGAQNTASLR
jgi:hypothetical protein